MIKNCPSMITTAVLAVVAGSSASAQDFSFELIGEDIFPVPSINEVGDVAFYKGTSEGGQILTGRPGSLTVAAEAFGSNATSGQFSQFRVLEYLPFTDNGQFTMLAQEAGSSGYVLAVNDQVVARADGVNISFIDRNATPQIINNGTVYFNVIAEPGSTVLDGGNSVWAKWNGGLSQEFPRFFSQLRADNNGNTYARGNVGQQGVFEGPNVEDIVLKISSQFPSRAGTPLPGGRELEGIFSWGVNDNGEFLVRGYTDDGDTYGLWAGLPGNLREVYTSSIFDAFNGPASINDDGDVLYVDREGNQGKLILDEAGGSSRTVIGIGDPLFGSTVNLITPGTQSLNSAGQFTFRAVLADGRTVGVYGFSEGPAIRWINVNGGDFVAAGNWSNSTSPSASDNVVFDLSNTYSVDFDDNQTVKSAKVEDGDVTFDFEGVLFTANTLTVGGDGQSATLTLRRVDPSIVSSIRTDAQGGHGEDEPILPTFQAEDAFVLAGGFLKVLSDDEENFMQLRIADETIIEGTLEVKEFGSLDTTILIAGENGNDGLIKAGSSDANRPAKLEADDVILGDSEFFGTSFGGNGTIEIGANATAEFGELTIGDQAEGRVLLKDGGKLEVLTDVVLGAAFGAKGTLALQSDADTALISGELKIGNTEAGSQDLDGSNVVILNGGRMFVVSDVEVNHASSIAAVGLPGAEALMSIGGDLIIAANASGVEVSDNAQMRFVSGGMVGIEIGYNAVFTIGGSLGLGSNVSADNGRLDVQIGTIAAEPTDSAATIIVSTGARFEAHEIKIGNADLAGGLLAVPGGQITAQTVRVSELGDLSITNDGFVLLGSPLEIELRLQAFEGGSLDLANRLFVASGGEFHFDAEISVPAGMRIDAGGLIQSGASPGKGEILGDLIIAQGGRWMVEIAGLAPEVDFDQIFVDGDATIEGDVVFRFLDGFAPQAGQTFDFLSATGAIDVSDATFSFENLQPGFEFEVNPIAGGFEMRALTDGKFIPEPTSLLLMTIGSIILGRRRSA